MLGRIRAGQYKRFVRTRYAWIDEKSVRWRVLRCLVEARYGKCLIMRIIRRFSI